MSHEGSGHISTEDEDKLDSVRPPNVNKNQNNNTANNRISTDSVFYRQSEELELTVRPTRRRDTVDNVLDLLQTNSLDLEKGKVPPLAHSSQGSQAFKPLPSVKEIAEKESCASLVRQCAISQTSDNTDADEPLLSHSDSNSETEC